MAVSFGWRVTSARKEQLAAAVAKRYPTDPDILKTVRVVNVLSVANLLRIVIHSSKCSEPLLLVLIYYVLSSESLCVVNSLQSSKTLQKLFF